MVCLARIITFQLLFEFTKYTTIMLIICSAIREEYAQPVLSAYSYLPCATLYMVIHTCIIRSVISTKKIVRP